MTIRETGRAKRCMVRTATIVLSAAAATGAGVAMGGGASAGASTAASAPSERATVYQSPASAPASDSSSLLRQGDSGAKVKKLQRQLSDLGYWIDSSDGKYGTTTVQAVYALQKAAGIDRDGVVGPETRKALKDGARPTAESSSGDVVEVDLDRQLLLLVSDGTVKHAFNTSTGSDETYESQGQRKMATTPEGKFSVSREVDGWRHAPLGDLYRPKYFNGGIAVHGYSSVPAYPASHGCVRVSMPAINWLWKEDKLEKGQTVLVR